LHPTRCRPHKETYSLKLQLSAKYHLHILNRTPFEQCLLTCGDIVDVTPSAAHVLVDAQLGDVACEKTRTDRERRDAIATLVGCIDDEQTKQEVAFVVATERWDDIAQGRAIPRRRPAPQHDRQDVLRKEVHTSKLIQQPHAKEAQQRESVGLENVWLYSFLIQIVFEHASLTVSTASDALALQRCAQEARFMGTMSLKPESISVTRMLLEGAEPPHQHHR
jgi:hypothetical protein